MTSKSLLHEVLLTRGNHLVTEKKFTAALPLLDDAVDLQPDNAVPYMLRATSLLALCKQKEDFDVYNRIIYYIYAYLLGCNERHF